jgi:hypothetical protein
LPQTSNFGQPLTVNSGLQVLSVRYRAFASVENRAVEIPRFQDARYIEWEFFTQRNLGGTSAGIASWDNGPQTLGQEFGGQTVDEIVQKIYPVAMSVT